MSLRDKQAWGNSNMYLVIDYYTILGVIVIVIHFQKSKVIVIEDKVIGNSLLHLYYSPFFVTSHIFAIHTNKWTYDVFQNL
jgi:hypothetical protein